MPRKARQISRTGIYHVVMRGINKQDIFFQDEDRRKFIRLIKEFKEICGFQVFALCLMSNHIHMLIKVNEEELGATIKRISASYVNWINKKYERCGHLFQERYKSEPVEDNSYFFTVLRYILQNPVKAGIVNSVADYKWSNFGDYISHGKLTDVDFVLSLFSEVKSDALYQFVQFVNTNNEDDCLEFETVRLAENDVSDFLIKLGIQTPQQLRQIERSERNKIFKRLNHELGISVRLLAKTTGYSRSTIERIVVR